MLRKTRPEQAQPDKAMSTWYLELDDWPRVKLSAGNPLPFW